MVKKVIFYPPKSIQNSPVKFWPSVFCEHVQLDFFNTKLLLVLFLEEVPLKYSYDC